MNSELVKGWKVFTTVEKYENRDAVAKGECDIQTIEGNVLLIEGVEAIWKRLAGAGDAPSAFNAANSHIGIGDVPQNPEGTALGGTANQATSDATGLRAETNMFYSPMMTDYPMIDGNKMTFKSEFGEDDANFVWHEWTVANGDSNTATNLNLKHEPMGEKYDGAIWRITVQISLT